MHMCVWGSRSWCEGSIIMWQRYIEWACGCVWASAELSAHLCVCVCVCVAAHVGHGTVKSYLNSFIGTVMWLLSDSMLRWGRIALLIHVFIIAFIWFSCTWKNGCIRSTSIYACICVLCVYHVCHSCSVMLLLPSWYSPMQHADKMERNYVVLGDRIWKKLKDR